jgi:protease-4
MLVIVLAIALSAGFYYIVSRPPAIEKETVVEVGLSGVVSELPAEDPFTILLGSRVQDLWELRRVFQAASQDERVTAIYLKIQPLLTSWAQIEEIRESVLSFRETGKQVHAFLAVDVATERELYLASAADHVTLNPIASVLMNGLMAEVVFMKRTMDKLGVRPQFIYFKEYKDPEIYNRESLTPEIREMLRSILEDLQDRFVTTVSADREVEEQRFRQLMDIGLLSAITAMDEGLIDAVGYEHQVRSDIQTATGTDTYRSSTISEYLETVNGWQREKSEARVAVVGAVGTIISGSSEPFAGLMGASTIAQRLREIREDGSFDGVILRVNSPGGSAVGSDMVWREVQLLEESEIPVVVSMSSSAASGGYYIAMGASRIVSQPSTITGSIGVTFGKFDLSGLYDWLGMDIDRIKLAPNADLFSTFSSMTPEQRSQVSQLIFAVYEDFVSKAAEGRHSSFDELEANARGRIYTGSQAIEKGLVDELGGFSAAVRAMKEELTLSPEDEIELQLHPRPKSFWEALASNELFEVRIANPTFQYLREELRRLEIPSAWLLAPEIQIR